MRFATSLALLLNALPATPQFQHLATDYTGSRLWFTTDLPARGSGQQAYARIWMADAQGRVTIAAERASSVARRILTRPQISADGAVFAYDAAVYCQPGTTCRGADPLHGIIATRGGETAIEGRIHLSRSGRWVLRESYLFFAPASQIEIIDRQTGTRRQIPVSSSTYMEGVGRISAAGSALVYANGLWLIRPDGSYTPVAAYGLDPDAEPSRWFSVRTPRVVMDDAATLVAYETTSGQRDIYVVQPGDEGSHRVIASEAWGPALSADGNQLAFISPANGMPQAWLIATTTGAERRQITRDPAGIAEAVLSGDGNVLWAVTLAGRIIRTELSSDTVQEIIPHTTVIASDPFGFPIRVAAGAIGRITGRGLASTYGVSGFPLATELSGVRLVSDGQPLPLLSVSPEEIRFQIPWEWTGRHTVSLPSTKSPFEDRPSRVIEAGSAAPEFLYSSSGLPIIIHEDFRGLVTQDDPARPGEILHFYVTGLGPVSPAVRTGEPAPASPLSFVTGQLHIFWQGSLPTNMPRPEVLFAGLAPGMAGVYQLDVRTPLIAPSILGISVGGSAAEFPVSMF